MCFHIQLLKGLFLRDYHVQSSIQSRIHLDFKAQFDKGKQSKINRNESIVCALLFCVKDAFLDKEVILKSDSKWFTWPHP